MATLTIQVERNGIGRTIVRYAPLPPSGAAKIGADPYISKGADEDQGSAVCYTLLENPAFSEHRRHQGKFRRLLKK